MASLFVKYSSDRIYKPSSFSYFFSEQWHSKMVLLQSDHLLERRQSLHFKQYLPELLIIFTVIVTLNTTIDKDSTIT